MKDPQIIDNETFFFGEYERTLDSQWRIAIPSEWRQQDETRLILLPGRDNDLLLFPYSTFREFLLKAGKLSLANRELQAALARIGSRARDCRCDKQGRMALDREKLDSIGVKKNLKLIGAVTHIRICAPENWIQPDNPDEYLNAIQQVSDGTDGLDALGGLLQGVFNK
jgi:MraZ protein